MAKCGHAKGNGMYCGRAANHVGRHTHNLPTNPGETMPGKGLRRAPRRFRVKFRDGTEETVLADSLDEAWSKARLSAHKQISVKQQGRKVVADVERERFPR